MGMTFDDFECSEASEDPERSHSEVPDISLIPDQKLVELLGEIVLEAIARRSQRDG